jgi:hypothetical protein
MMQPLEVREIGTIDASASRVERFCGYVPVLGWIIANTMWRERTRPIVRKIEA